MNKLVFALALLCAPATWASTWYVRSSGTCANNGNGTASACAASPGGVGGWSGFANINWAGMAAGDTLNLVSGDTYVGQLTIGKAGTAGSPITITVSGGGTATIDANGATGISFNGNNFVTLNGVTGNAAFGGSTTYGLRIINIGVANYCIYMNNGEQNDKVLHVECTGKGQNTDSAFGGVPTPDDNRGGIFCCGTGGINFEAGYNWFHQTSTEYALSSCTQSASATFTCNTVSTISDPLWTSPLVSNPSVAVWGTSGASTGTIVGHCGLVSASGNTITCTAGLSGTGSTTGGTATLLWAATGITGFSTSGTTNFNDSVYHDNLAHGLFNDGFRCSSNCTLNHNEASVVVGSQHSDSLLVQSASYAAVSNNYVHDSNDQNCYLDNLANSTKSHVRIYNNIFNSPKGFGGCNVDPEGGASSVWDDIEFLNNTSLGSRSYVFNYSARGTITNITYLNNISGVSGAAGQPPMNLGTGATFVATGDPYDYDTYSPSGTQYPTVAHLAAGNFTLASLASGPGYETHGKACDVAYVGGAFPGTATPTNADTCANGFGINLFSTYPFLQTDFTGAARLGSGPWVIGAITQSSGTPTIAIAPSPIAFANQAINTTSGQLTVTITNNGTANETLGSTYWTITGANAGDFANALAGTCGNFTVIAPGGSCTVKFTFTPSAGGARNAIFTLVGTINAVANLTGTGLAPAVQLNPTSIAFGNQNTGTSSPNHAVTLTNNGLAIMHITSIASTDATHFPINTNTCGATLAIGASCGWNVTFAPTSVGALSASITITTDAGTSPDSLPMTGTGITPITVTITILPNPLIFGNQIQNTASLPLTVTVTSTGTGNEVLNTPFFTITGTNSADFIRTGGTCTNGQTLTPAQSCTVLVVFTPSTLLLETATLNISGTVSGNISMTGSGIAASPAPAPAPQILVSYSGSTMTLNVKNATKCATACTITLTCQPAVFRPICSGTVQ